MLRDEGLFQAKLPTELVGTASSNWTVGGFGLLGRGSLQDRVS
jgi:hypothetical protein